MVLLAYQCLSLTAKLVTNETTEVLRDRARSVSQIGSIVTLIAFVLAGVWLYSKDGYVVTSTIDHFAPSSPMNKEVAVETGAWFRNFNEMPILWIFLR